MTRAKNTTTGKTLAKKTKQTKAATKPDASDTTASSVSPEQRWRMIAEAAYYRAQARGFQGGNPAEDWTAAEAEIDGKLPRDRQQDEQAAYDRLRQEVQKGLAAVKGSVDAKAIQDTIERAADRVKRAGVHAGSSINKAAESLKREIAQAAAAMGPRWEAFSDKTADVFAVWRDRGSVFLARAATAVGDWLNQTGRRFERPQYRAGEAVSSGSFQCLQCGALLHMEAAGNLPPCDACQHTEFRRVP